VGDALKKILQTQALCSLVHILVLSKCPHPASVTMMVVERLRRDATKVIYEILTLGLDGASKTHIIYKANLSFQLAEKYTFFLIKKGLLKTEKDPEGLTRYWLTERGIRLLKLLRDVEQELGDFFIRSPSSETASHGPI